MLGSSVRHESTQPVGVATVGGSRGAALTMKIAAFLQVSDALALSRAEERTLLDLSAAQLEVLRSNPAAAQLLVSPRLERRVDYANTILRRMLAASES
jgi:hypothetical protein